LKATNCDVIIKFTLWQMSQSRYAIFKAGIYHIFKWTWKNWKFLYAETVII